MPLWFSENTIGYCSGFRVLWLRGRYGSGKTLAAFRIAHQLKLQGRVRYILSNCASVWNDNPEDVVLIESAPNVWTADAVIVMDEAGMFMHDTREAREYLAYMRKINVILLLASVLAPAPVVRSVSIKRMFNFERIGVPLWVFETKVIDGEQVDRERWAFWQPSEMFGIYNTAAFPADDDGIKAYIHGWVREAASKQGADLTTIPGIIGNHFVVLGEENGTETDGLGDMAEAGRIAQVIEENTAALNDTLPVLSEFNKKRRH